MRYLLVFVIAFGGFGSLAAGSVGILNYNVYVSNERSGDLSVIDGASHRVMATVPVGKRPRGIHVAPDGKTLCVAVSSSPIVEPGANPDRAKAPTLDREADGIVRLDTSSLQTPGKLEVGSDPEQFAFAAAGAQIAISNEDLASVSIFNLAEGKLLRRFAVGAIISRNREMAASN